MRDVRALAERLAQEREREARGGPWSPARLRATLHAVPARRAGRDPRQPRALHPRAERPTGVARAAPGERPRHRARAGDARLLRRLGRARQRHRPTARPSTRTTACGCRRARSRTCSGASGSARRRRTATTTASRTRGSGRSATSPTRARSSAAEDWEHYVRGEPQVRRRGLRRGRQRRPDRPRAGLSLRAGAADDPRAAAARDDHHLLAHPVAERRALRHLPVARGAHLGAARLEHRRLPHAAALQQLHRFGRRLHREPHRSRSATRSSKARRRTLVRPYPISIEWPVRWLEERAARRGVRAPRCGASSGSPPTRCSASASIGSTTPRASRSGLPAVDELLAAPPRVPRPLHLRPARRAQPHQDRPLPRAQRARRSARRGRSTRRGRSGDYRPIVLLRVAPRAADRLPLLSRGRPLLREQPARRHEPGGQGVRRRARRRAGRARAEPVHRRRARADRGADRQPVRSAPGERRAGGGAAHAADEQRERMRSMRRLVAEFNVYRWAGRMLVDAAELRRKERMSGRLSSMLTLRRRRVA